MNVKWIMGLIAGIIMAGATGFITHVETKFNYYDTTHVALFSDIAAIKAQMPDSDRRLVAIEKQLIELNGNVAALTALARVEFKKSN